jgi:predicted amidophosphoribosyltransferase
LKRTDVPECASCGYNLTGNQSGICPECGTRVPYALWRRRYPPPPEAELEPNPIRYSP